MRLIDADKLIEELCDSCSKESCDGMGRNSTAKCYSVTLVEEQPAVFDIEKVIEQLHNAGGCDGTNDYDKGWDDAIAEAEGIVKKGGAE